MLPRLSSLSRALGSGKARAATANAAASADTSLSNALQRCATPAELETLLLSTQRFSEETCALALSKMVALRCKSKPALDHLVQASNDLVFQPKELTLCLQAFASKRLGSELPHSFLVQVEHSLPYLKANGVHDALLAVANLHQVPKIEFFDAIAQEIMDRDMLVYFQRTALVGVIGAMAKLNYVPAQILVDRFAQEVNSRDEQKYTASEWIVLYTALEKWGANLAPLMERTLRVDLAQWKARDLAQLLPCIAKIASQKHKNQRLMAHIERALGGKDLTAFFPESLIAVLSSSTIAAVLDNRGKNMDLVARVVAELETRNFQYFSPAQLTEIATNLARLRYSASSQEAVLGAIGTELERRAADFSSLELVQILRAFALFSFKDSAAAAALGSVAHAFVERELAGLDFDDLVDVCFSFAVLDALKSNADVQRFFFQLSQIPQESSAPAVVGEMLQLTKLAWSLAVPKRSSPLLKSLDRARWSETAITSSEKTGEINALHESLYNMLDDFLEDDILEFKTKCGSGTDCRMNVDVLIKTKRIAIEFEPATSMLSCGTKRIGEVQFRRKMLAKQGYTVFAFPMKGFGNLPQDQRELRVKEFVRNVVLGKAV